MGWPCSGRSLLVSWYVGPRAGGMPRVSGFPAPRSTTPLGSLAIGTTGTAARLIWAFHWSVGYWLQGASSITLLETSILLTSLTVETQSVPSSFCACVSGGTGAGLIAPLGSSL